MSEMPRLVAIALATSLLVGCALTRKSDPLVPRFFSPDLPAGAPAVRLTSALLPPASTDAGVAPPELRLGRVVAAAHLREKIAFRGAGHELGYEEERRWTERPDVYVRRALERTLFESGGFTHVVSGQAPTLEVEVLAFEELRAPRKRAAELELHLALTDGRAVLREETLLFEEPLAAGGDQTEALAAAMGAALRAAADRAAHEVRAALGAAGAAPMEQAR